MALAVELAYKIKYLEADLFEACVQMRRAGQTEELKRCCITRFSEQLNGIVSNQKTRNLHLQKLRIAT